MAKGGKILASILRKLEIEIKKKKTNGLKLEIIADDLAKKAGGTPSFKNYQGYPASLCVSINCEVVHGIPNDIYFKEGDLVKIDFGLWYRGLCTDAAITCPVGKVSRENLKLIETTKESLKVGISQAKVKNHIGDIGAAIEKFVLMNRFSVVKDLVGHGVGKKVHEPPQIPNFGKPGSGDIMKEGMTLAIEPMVNAGSFRITFGNDGWTVKTADLKNSAHFEHTIAITSDGPLILTKE